MAENKNYVETDLKETDEGYWLDEEDDEEMDDDFIYGSPDAVEKKTYQRSGQPGFVKEEAPERPLEAMSRKERKIYKQRKKQEAQLEKIRVAEEAERDGLGKL